MGFPPCQAMKLPRCMVCMASVPTQYHCLNCHDGSRRPWGPLRGTCTSPHQAAHRHNNQWTCPVQPVQKPPPPTFRRPRAHNPLVLGAHHPLTCFRTDASRCA